jgi:hypothetical protein
MLACGHANRAFWFMHGVEGKDLMCASECFFVGELEVGLMEHCSHHQQKICVAGRVQSFAHRPQSLRSQSRMTYLFRILCELPHDTHSS